MASKRSSWWQRILFRTPLYRRGKYCANYHPIWEQLCYCCVDEHGGGFNGGVYDLRNDRELFLSRELPGDETLKSHSRYRLLKGLMACGGHFAYDDMVYDETSIDKLLDGVLADTDLTRMYMQHLLAVELENKYDRICR